MNWADEFVELDRTIHDRASFDCGEAELNAFIRTHAAKHMEAGVSTTMLLAASTPLSDGKYPICAFYTIAPSSIARETLPEARSKELPHYPVPVFLLAQMAVRLECHGYGLGKITLIKALGHLWKINSSLRGYAIIVDCLNKNAEQFYSKYDFQVLDDGSSRTRMFIPMDTVEMLFQ
ncbi:MAG: GNAT family N-acetyltransferase [Dehalococcoidia bacterium]